ncbi:MAG: hypothetical protein ABSG59_16755 [Verrucomicrobiota bacterium]
MPAVRIRKINFDAQKIRLLKPEKPRKSDETVPLQLRSCRMRVSISVDGQRQWVRLDTGCSTGLQWVSSDVPDQCIHQIAIGLAQISIPQTTTTGEVGELKFENVPTGLHEKAIFPGEAGLLGNGVLSRFSTITIDAKAGRLILEQNRPIASCGD